MSVNTKTVQREELYRAIVSERDEDLERLEAMMHSYAACSEGSLPLYSLMHSVICLDKTRQEACNSE